MRLSNSGPVFLTNVPRKPMENHQVLLKLFCFHDGILFLFPSTLYQPPKSANMCDYFQGDN